MYSCVLGKVRVISCRETVPKGFKPNLLAECPETFQPKSGETETVRMCISCIMQFSHRV